MTLYTNNLPLAADKIRNFPSDVSSKNWPYLTTSMGTDHNFTQDTATAEDGYHKIVHSVKQAGIIGDNTPAIPTVVTAAQLYTKTLTYKKQAGNASTREVYMQQPGSRAQALEETALGAAPIRAAVSITSGGQILGAAYNVSAVSSGGVQTVVITFVENMPNDGSPGTSAFPYIVQATCGASSLGGPAIPIIVSKLRASCSVQYVHPSGTAITAPIDIIVLGGWAET